MLFIYSYIRMEFCRSNPDHTLQLNTGKISSLMLSWKFREYQHHCWSAETNDIGGARRPLAGVDGQDRKSIVAKREDRNALLFVVALRGNVDMVEFLAKECHAELEELGLYTNSRGIVELVTPLWCAVIWNEFEVAKRLINLGANIHAVSDFSKTSVLGACIMNVDFVGCPHCASRNHCFKEKDDLVDFLIDLGADPHWRNIYDDDCFQIACLNGQVSILEKLLLEFKPPIRRSIDMYELIGSFYAHRSPIDIEKVLLHWKKAVEMRRMHSYFDGNASKPNPVYGVTKEVSTVEESETLCQNLDFVYMHALMIRDRILSPNHYQILTALLYRGQVYSDDGEFRRCIDILKYAFELHNTRVEHMPIQHLRMWYFPLLGHLCLVFLRITQNVSNSTAGAILLSNSKMFSQFYR